MRVLAKRDRIGIVSNERRKAFSDAGRHRLGAFPLSVHELGGVEPGPLLRLEADVGPGLMRVAGQQKALTDSESRIVPGERIFDQATSLSPC